jgi:hypothetical protein
MIARIENRDHEITSSKLYTIKIKEKKNRRASIKMNNKDNKDRK